VLSWLSFPDANEPTEGPSFHTGTAALLRFA